MPQQQLHQSPSTGRVRRPQMATVRSAAPSAETNQGQQRSLEAVDPIQDEIRRVMAEYRNTPPLFVTATRDFFVDVARYPLGFKLTTMQAVDSEGDRIHYSLKPTNYRDASPYFSINSTTGELRLANKRIPMLNSSRLGASRGAHLLSSDTGDATGSEGGTGEEDEEEDDDHESTSTTKKPEANGDRSSNGSSSGQLMRSVQQQESNVGDEQDKPGYLYFLNVAANDGKYTSVVELQIHVFNSTSFGTKSPVQLPIEGGRHTGEQLMHAKTAEFFDQLYSHESTPISHGRANKNQHSHHHPISPNNSTLVYPSFVNPSLIDADRQDYDTTTISSSVSTDMTDATEPGVPTTRLSPLNSSLTSGVVMTSEHASANQLAPGAGGRFSSPVPSLPYVEPAAHLDNNLKHTDMLNQPMMLSMVIIICSCFTVALVLLIFVVPLSVRRLKKRLKNVERQHEQLSEKPSNGGGSSIICSNASSTSGRSMTISSTSGSRHLPSTLSQFTLASSDRSCAAAMLQLPSSLTANEHQQRLQIGRQSSLDSAITSGLFSSLMSPASASSYNSHSAQYQQQQAAANMRHLQAHHGDSNFAAHHHHNHHQHHHMQSQQQQPPPVPPTPLTNGLNRINNGAISNPAYLHQFRHGDAAADAKAQQFSVGGDSDNIYCPIDEEFYSTINTEITTIQGAASGGVLGNNCTTMGMMSNQDPGMVGSLIGETFDSRNYFASQCAPQQASMTFTAPGRPTAADRRDTDTPNSISSHSSTRSLARFLSLPARHLSHQQQPDTGDCGGDNALKRKQASSFLDELECSFKTAPATEMLGKHLKDAPVRDDSRAVANHQAAQTIARTNHIAQEQQVGKGAKSAKSGNIKRHKSLVDTTSTEPKQQQQEEPHVWELARHRLKFLDQIDEGQFGQVWRCKLRMASGDNCDSDWATMKNGTERTVAVKTLKSFFAKDERERQDLLAEIEIMKLVCNHPNVVRILHCCTKDISQSKPIFLVMEHVELGKLQSFLKKSRSSHNYATVQMAAGSLYNGTPNQRQAATDASEAYFYCDDESSTTTTVYEDALGGQRRGPMMAGGRHHNKQEQLTSRELIKFIYHVANGMEYISGQLIVHRDLASRNILVSSQRVCKVGDFGMARQIGGQDDVYECQTRNTKVPVRWMAPEALLNNSFTTKSDVYSFGILMWEIVTLGSTPYMHLETGQIIDAVAKLGERPSRPDYCHAALYNIMSRCWLSNPSDRPSFTQLVRELDELLLSTNEYIELDQYPDHNYYNIPQAAAPLELL